MPVLTFNTRSICVCVQIANSNPLVSERQELAVLQKEYAEDDTVYQLKIKVSLQLHPHLHSPASYIP